MRPLQIGKHTISNPVMLAPMAGVSEMPYRVLSLERGAGLATTELISAKGIFYKNHRTRQYLTYNKEKEVPYSVQLFGGDEEAMCAAAREAYRHGADIIDINMGCPVKKVTKTGSGSALLCDPKRAARLIIKMREAVEDRVPVTAKIRLGWDDKSINCIEMTQRFEDAGCAALAVHGRTRAQAYSGEANWDWIRQMKSTSSEMPIIGNGDVFSYEDGLRMFEQTGCDGILIGRGALGNPWIFESFAAGHKVDEPTGEERRQLIQKHYEAHLNFHKTLEDGREKKLTRGRGHIDLAVRTFRQHLIWYSRGLPGSKHFKKSVVTIEEPEEVLRAIDAYFPAIDDWERGRERQIFGEDADDGVNYKTAYG